MTPSGLSQVLEILYVCESIFEYKVSSEVVWAATFLGYVRSFFAKKWLPVIRSEVDVRG